MLLTCTVPTNENYPAITGKSSLYKDRMLYWKDHSVLNSGRRVSGKGLSLSLKYICAQRHQVEENKS